MIVFSAYIAAGLAASAEENEQAAADEDPFAFLLHQDTRPLATRIQTDFSGSIDAGFSYVSEDSFTFGRYNGLDQDGLAAYLNMDLGGRDSGGWLSGLITEWRFIGQDLGLDTRQLDLSFGRARDYGVRLSFDQQQQVNNNTGRTPFFNGSDQQLPEDWVAANITSGMTELVSASRQFDQELRRDRLSLAIDKSLGDWRFAGELASEDKDGSQPFAGAFYVDGSNGHAAVLQRPVDYTTSELDLSAAFARDALTMEVSYLYSDFDNSDDFLRWQNPYDAEFGLAVDYPLGSGQLALEPDNEMHRLRAVGSYTFTPRLRLSLDGSYGKTTQDQNFLPYTINELPQTPLLRNNFDGEVYTSTFNGTLYYRPEFLPKLTLKGRYHYEDRDNDSPRDGYLYVRGDAWSPDDDKFTVYNTTHERSVNRGNIEGSYRLPWRGSKLTLGYGYEEIERHNAAAEKTEEDSYSATLSLRPLATVTARLSIDYRDRGASNYHWDQSFYALLDTELINEIPDNQRYINHPELSQYYLSNRERIGTSASLSWVPDERWNLLLDFSYIDNDYDQTNLGLEEDTLTHLTLSAGYAHSEDLSMNVFYSYDEYEARQTGRAFRGGIEKNAFDVIPPLAQASDPERDWRFQGDDKTHSVGANARWIVITDKLEMEWEYSFYDAEGSSDFDTFGAPDLLGAPLPDNTSKQHQLRWVTSYHLRDELSLNFEYQYYRFDSDDWALDDVGFTSLNKVIWTGERSPSDVVQYFLISAQYRLRQ
jgi:MtrB/PioB family decaheme-associated outer membrane protein